MAYVLDPEGVETRTVHRLVDFHGKDVLEVGCWEGRLTWRYADQAASVLAIDLRESKIALARGHTPEHLRSSITFQIADIASLNAPEASFDVAILSWSSGLYDEFPARVSAMPWSSSIDRYGEGASS